jgi:hypothetical protein
MSSPVSSDQNEEGSNETDLRNAALSVLVAIRRSFLLFVAAVGLILVAIGASPLVNGLFAGMFGIWGATALVCAGLGFVGVKLLQIFDM